jgi:hypothetical protein
MFDVICCFVFRFDAGVQQFGCWALSNLALSGEEVLRKMKKKGAIEVCTRTHTMCVVCVFVLQRKDFISTLFILIFCVDLPNRPRDTPEEP